MPTRTCVDCGAIHGELGAIDRNGEWRRDHDIHSLNSAVGESLFGEFPETKVAVVVTTASGELRCRVCHLAAVRTTMPTPDPIERAMTRAAKRGQTHMEFPG